MPAGFALARSSRRGRAALLPLLAFSPVLTDMASINFVSREAYRGPDRGFEVTLTDLLAVSLAAAALTRGRLPRPLPAGFLLMLALFGLAVLSLVDSSAPLLGGFTVFELLRGMLLYWAVVNTVREERDRDALRTGLALAGVVVGVIAFWQRYRLGIYRVPGPFDHSNTIPLYAHPALAMLLTLGLAPRVQPLWRRVLSVAGGLGLLFAVVATLSRAGMALAGAAACLALVLALAGHPRRVRLGPVLLIGSLLALGGLKASDSLMRRMQDAPKESAEARDEFNHAAQLMAEDRTLGVGINLFSEAMTRNDRYRAHVQVMGQEEHAGVCHHIYWLTAAELGYPGLVLFLMWLLRLWLVPLGGLLRLPGAELRPLIAGSVGVGCLHLAGLFEWGFRITPVYQQFLLVSALLVASGAPPRRGSREIR
jgi:hypothetical protein